MQVFNSFQEMAAGTGALGAQGTMSVFNADEPNAEKSRANIRKMRLEQMRKGLEQRKEREEDRLAEKREEVQ